MLCYNYDVNDPHMGRQKPDSKESSFRRYNFVSLFLMIIVTYIFIIS